MLEKNPKVTERLVSICIPVYNGEKFLQQCLESCLAQSYPYYEVVICDDCSTDRSEEIVRVFKEKNPRISYFRNERNYGLVENWNNTIKRSNGTWIKMLFQDDYLAPDCLEQFMKAAADDVPLLVSRRNFVFDYRPEVRERTHYGVKSRTFDRWANGKVITVSPRRIAAAAARNIAINVIGEPSLAMFNKSAAINAGLFDRDFIQICDLDFLLRMSADKGLVYLPHDLCFFRLHANTTTNMNLDTRWFELRYLEPLLMAARLLTHPSYEPLRQQMSRMEIFRVSLYLKTRLLEARMAAARSGKKAALEQYLKQHPSIQSEGQPAMIHRIAYQAVQLKRAVKKIIRKG